MTSCFRGSHEVFVVVVSVWIFRLVWFGWFGLVWLV